MDLVGYKGARNELLVVECKSFLDSRGVVFAHVTGADRPASRLYKLFNEPILRRVVLSRLWKQLAEDGLCRPHPKVVLGMATGRIATDRDRRSLQVHFDGHGWKLFDETWICDRLREFQGVGYENNVGVVVAKLLLKHG